MKLTGFQMLESMHFTVNAIYSIHDPLAGPLQNYSAALQTIGGNACV